MRKLILVKHSLPDIDSTRPAHLWSLTAKGREKCQPLAEKLAAYRPKAIFASNEPKAMQTARLVGEFLDKPAEILPGLHEHERHSAPFFPNKAGFEEAMINFFANPADLVYGEETAAQALERFGIAVSGILEQHRSGNIVIVAHGTVSSLFVAANNKIEPFPLWQRLGLPSYVVLALPGFELVEVMDGLKNCSTKVG